ncbi:fatty acid synthase-like [Epargyreus clarus]|uniref:fatty acid synthase-like n=1 Tax=Epargyreus clarus TaxID=520877 RepID=UPI003C3017F2
MSGLYPNSAHVKDLADILYNKKNPVTSEDSRWNYEHPEVAQYMGNVPQLQFFDAQFFKVHFRLGNSMDSMSRKILEQAFQAIYDAGVSPEQLYGKKVGVYIGTCFSETEKACFYVASSRTGFGIAGCNKSMFANRISYWLNAKGPSMSVDDACCSSTAAVELAFEDIKRGECEAAIVGGANLCLHPQSSIHYNRIMKLSKDGKTKSFDEDASGCAKSEAINVLFLQKAKYARRIYAEIVHVKTEFTSIPDDETGPKYGFYRDPSYMIRFLKSFYDKAQIPAEEIEYVEAFGSGIPEADKAELVSLENVFCKNRKDPLLVGSVMSNIGYAEAASGINAITKVLLGYHTGELAANLHCESPRRDVAALRDGRMRVVRDHTRFGREYTAVNGMSVTGVNSHVLLHGRYKPKDLSRYKSNIPYLVTVSGRQESAVTKILNDLKSRPIDPEELTLFHHLHETRISGHLGRGFIIIDTNEENKTVSLFEKADYFDDVKCPLWFVYSGMGSQWAGMGTALMRIPVFAAAIERCRVVLEPRGVDIVNIITSQDKTTFDNILNCFVGIAAIQIGLTDVLREIGLVPDNIIGHSVGELGCAYADGCFTAEEMILSAYSRGLVSVQTPFIRGSMAAVGIGYEQIYRMCPPEIEVACHNGPDSCTISGPANVMREFVAQLTAKNIFAKEVPCANIAYHSRYIAEAGPELLKYLKDVIKSPKARSERWVSTSVPMDKWGEESAKYSSAEYHTNNLLNPVLFEETSRLIPANAVLIEIAPHGLLQAILKRSLPSSCKNIPLTRRGHPDNVRLVLEALGHLYMQGYNPRLQALYPKIEFPVSTGTPMLSHLVEWAHHEKWVLPLYVAAHRETAAATNFVLSIHDVEHRYLQGNVVKGKILYPFAGVLVAVWDTLAMTLGVPRRQLTVRLRDVVLHTQPILHDRRQLRLSIRLQRGTGQFEVMDDCSNVTSGYITSVFNNKTTSPVPCQYGAEDELDQDTIYQMLYMRDFSYRDDFRSIQSANASMSEARVLWKDNWVTLIDGMFQLNVLRNQHGSVSQPEYVRSITINVQEFAEDKSDYKIVNVSEDHTRCKGILIENIRLRDLQMNIDDDNLLLKSLQFVPHFQSEITDIATTIHVYLQIVAENVNKNNINILEIKDNKTEVPAFNDIKNIVDISGIKGVYKCVERDRVLEERDNFLSDVDVFLVSNISRDDTLCQILYRVLPRETFLMNKEDHQVSSTARPSALYRVVCSHNIGKADLQLARWRPASAAVPTSAISVRSTSDLDLLSATQASLLPRQKLLVLTSYPPIPGLKDLIKQWRKEHDSKIHLAMINHKLCDDQNLDQMPNIDFAYNILDHGMWGSEYYLPLRPNITKKEEVMLQCPRIGDLNSLTWVEKAKSDESGVKVTVHYAGLNNVDVKKLATGIIPFEKGVSEGFGMDFSGITETGERVMGIVQQGSVTSSLRVSPYQLWPVPAHWTLEDAATVPLAYCLAYYCLALRRQMNSGINILVHGGAGALGQAVISIALAQHCEVFATVSTAAKKRFLLKLFPNLKAANIGNSRDVTFSDMVMSRTSGKGVDVIISCLKGELKTATLKCGRMSSFVFDVDTVICKENYDYGMSHLNRERTYYRVDLFSIFREGKEDDMKRLQRLVCEGVSRGWVRPLSRVTYAPLAAPRALRLLAAAAQRGRVLLRTQPTQDLCVQPRLQCTSNLHHVILCDNDLVGIQLSEKLIRRGVNKLILRRFNSSVNLSYKLRQWKNMGVQVNEATEDFTSFNITTIREPLEGIYVALMNCDKSVEYRSLLSNLDIQIRQSYSALKHFAVMCTDDSFATPICISRMQDRLPATLIKLPQISKMDDANTSVSHKKISVLQATEAVEQALCSSDTITIAHANISPKRSIITRIANIAGVSITKKIQNTTTLSDLQINAASCKAIHAFLRDIYNVSLSEVELPNMTIQAFLDLEKTLTDVEFENVTGLNTLYSFVDDDELLATTEIVLLPTLVNGTTMRSDEFNVKQTHLCIVPGVEGHHGRFQTLCEHLKLPALALQPGLDRPFETVREMACRYAKVLKEKTGLKSNFYLLGYESGVLVALEMAAVLEEYGFSGTVFCIGVPPKEFKNVLKEQLSGLDTEELLQDAVVRHMFTLMTGNNADELNIVLENVQSWQDKLEITVRTLLGRVPHSAQYARQLIQTAYGRIATLLRHESEPRALRSRLVLLQPRSPQPLAAHAAALQPHSLQPVAAHELRAPLAHAAHDLRCAAIINTYLSPDILEDFKNKNLCESYLLNANSFMSTC